MPYKSLVDRGIDISEGNFAELQKGLMKYKDTYFTIENIQPHAFVEQVFLLYDFICKECIYSDLEEISFEFEDEEQASLDGDDEYEQEFQS